MKIIEAGEIEISAHTEGYEIICGVDEAGRGPLAGAVCAAAVILPRGCRIVGLDDSKKLSAKQRDALYNEIVSVSESFGIAFAGVAEIEELNIQNAAYLAMDRAIDKLTVKPDLCLIDGNRFTGAFRPVRCIVGGDGKCANIAAASVLAKVTRDRLMLKLAEQYPQYAFERHKGYGTKLHYEMLRLHGPSPVHRMSFLRKFYSAEKNG